MFKSILMFLALIVLARPALADECNSRVYDTTGKVTDIAGIESTLKSLVGDGADPTLVRVISTAQMNEIGNLDKYAGSMLKRCPSWQSAGGGLKSNIFLMVVEPSGTIAILFNKKGPFQNVLGGKTQAIRDEMGGLLSKGDIAGSIKAGLIMTHSLLAAPRSAPAGASGPVTIVNHNEKPADLSGLWTFMKWLLALGVIGAGIWLFARYQSQKSKRNAAQQGAQNARGACTNLISGFDTHLTTLSVLMGPLKNMISTTEYAAFQGRIEDLKGKIASSKNQFVSQSGSSNDPESVGLSADAYDSMTNTYERIQATLERVDAEATKLENSIRGVSRLRDSAQPAIDELTKDIETATNAINAETVLRVDGPRATLKRAIDCLERAEGKLADKSYQAVLDACKEGSILALKAAKEVKDLAFRKRTIENHIQQLDANSVSDSLTIFDETISTTRQAYGDESVAGTSAQRASVVQKLTERRIAIASAKSAVTNQNWDQAEQQIAIAQNAGSSIATTISSVQGIGARIARERQQAAAAAALSSYSSRPSSSHSHHTHVTNNYGSSRRDDDGPGFGTGLAAGVLGTLAVESILDSDRRERREESSGWGSRSNNDNDGGSLFGGDSGRSDPEPDSSPWGGDSGSSSSSNDDSGFNNSND